MSSRAFYLTLLAVLATVAALSVTWEFWLEDRLMSGLAAHHEAEPFAHRLEFVLTATAFSLLALIVPAVIGTRLIRHDEALRQTVVRLSQEDYLTGLHNRRRITELLDDEIRRASRYEKTFCLILADVDHFKAINDRHGHQVGDEALTRFADVLRSDVRATDQVGRWGGEEFLIISPETEIGGGRSLAEKIRARVETADLGEVGRMTASFGVTDFAAGDGVEEITARADAALYAAKQGGRNRVEASPAGAGESRESRGARVGAGAHSGRDDGPRDRAAEGAST